MVFLCSLSFSFSRTYFCASRGLKQTREKGSKTTEMLFKQMFFNECQHNLNANILGWKNVGEKNTMVMGHYEMFYF